jgi:hypothetical protein
MKAGENLVAIELHERLLNFCTVDVKSSCLPTGTLAYVRHPRSYRSALSCSERRSVVTRRLRNVSPWDRANGGRLLPVCETTQSRRTQRPITGLLYSGRGLQHQARLLLFSSKLMSGMTTIRDLSHSLETFFTRYSIHRQGLHR